MRFFLEIGYEEDHVHFLVQSVPTNCVDELVRVIQTPSRSKEAVVGR